MGATTQVEYSSRGEEEGEEEEERRRRRDDRRKKKIIISKCKALNSCYFLVRNYFRRITLDYISIC